MYSYSLLSIVDIYVCLISVSDACIFYQVHQYLIAIIKIMLKYICHIPHDPAPAPAPTPSLIPVLLFSHDPDYVSHKI